MNVPFKVLFGETEVLKSETNEWPTHETQKRKGPPPNIVAAKKAKITRGDELVEDPEARAVATNILEQIKNTPGIIELDFKTPNTMHVVPLNPSYNIPSDSSYTPKKIEEGQLKTLLALPMKNFGKLKIPKIKGGVTKTAIPSRSMDIPTIRKNLEQPDKFGDEYIGFSAAVANVLRRCDTATGERLAETIANLLQQEALPNIK